MPKRKFAALHSAYEQPVVELTRISPCHVVPDFEDSESKDRYLSNVKASRNSASQLSVDGHSERRRDTEKSSDRLLEGQRAANRLTSDRVYALATQYKTLLVRYLKAARGVERQKLGRRLKQAASSTTLHLDGQNKVENTVKQQEDARTTSGERPEEIQHGTEKSNDRRKRLQKEIQALREMNLDQTAELHLLKSLLKSAGRLLHSTTTATGLRQDLEARVQVLTRGQGGSQEHWNVLGRLFRVNNVIEGARAFVDEVKAVLEIEEASFMHTQTKRDMLQDKDSDFEGFEEDEETNKFDLNNGAVEGDQESDSEDEEMLYDRHASRLASSETSSSNSLYSDSASESSPPQNGPSTTNKHRNPTISRPNYTASLRPSRPAANPSSTTFLPSLSLAAGGYISGSESGSESAPDATETRRQLSTGPRKNRMGQQARRALWEKKYGSGAKHLKNPTAGGAQGQDAAWGRGQRAKHGGALGQQRKRGSGGRKSLDRGPSGRATAKGNVRGGGSGANTTALGVRTGRHTGAGARGGATAGAALHPSWEAAKRAKEARTGAEFKGKKVVF